MSMTLTEHLRKEWYAVYVKSQHERKVASLLAGQQVSVFLPTVQVKSRRANQETWIDKVLFPGYVLVEANLMEGTSRLAIKKTPGVLHFVGYGAEPSPVPRQQVESLQIAVDGQLRIDPYPYLQEGQVVEVISGPFKGMVGILVEKQASKHRLVLSIDLMNKSVITTIDACQVAPYR